MSPYGKGRRLLQVGVSPKVSVPTSVLAVAGAALAVLDAAGVLHVDDSLWLGLLAAGGVTGVTGYAASPGTVRQDRGLSLVEVLIVLLAVAVVLMLAGVL